MRIGTMDQFHGKRRTKGRTLKARERGFLRLRRLSGGRDRRIALLDGDFALLRGRLESTAQLVWLLLELLEYRSGSGHPGVRILQDPAS